MVAVIGAHTKHATEQATQNTFLKNVHYFDGVIKNVEQKNGVQQVAWWSSAKSIRLTPDQLKQVEEAGAKDPVDAWRKLAEFGDRYAMGAAEALGEPGSLKYRVVRSALWLADADPNNVTQAEKDHLKNYINYIKRNYDSANNTYGLPLSTQIETSYYNSMVKNDISPYAATALLFSKITHEGWQIPPTWHDFGIGLDLESDRKGPPSEEAKGLDGPKAFGRLAMIIAVTAAGYGADELQKNAERLNALKEKLENMTRPPEPHLPRIFEQDFPMPSIRPEIPNILPDWRSLFNFGPQ